MIAFSWRNFDVINFEIIKAQHSYFIFDYDFLKIRENSLDKLQNKAFIKFNCNAMIKF